jgi:hypothetical protein
MKSKHALFAFALLLVAAACARHIQETEAPYAPTAEETAWIKERLLTIKGELYEFDRIDDNLHWKIADCRAPYNDPYPVAYKDTIFNKDSLWRKQQLLRASASTDMDTHGRALYRLYVKAKLEYSRAGSLTQPENQVIVKATYQPISLESAQPHSDKQAALGADGKWYREGEPSDLYIMFRTDRKGIQTDAGWVYGIVSMQEDKVIAQGLLSNCMGCHRENAPDRLFGMGE